MLSVSEGSITVCEESPGKTFVNRHRAHGCIVPISQIMKVFGSERGSKLSKVT